MNYPLGACSNAIDLPHTSFNSFPSVLCCGLLKLVQVPWPQWDWNIRLKKHTPEVFKY